jgi:hypothetical protein
MKYILATIALAASISVGAAEDFGDEIDIDELLSPRTCQSTIEDTHSHVEPRLLETYMAELLDEEFMDWCKDIVRFKTADSWQQLGELSSWYRGKMFEYSRTVNSWYKPNGAAK